MGKKKKKIQKPWCYYCEREFDDEAILVHHQKAKHYRCHVCRKKLSTAGGMAIHVLQVHKESVTRVPNAKPGRESTDIDIFGMEGIPLEILVAHNKEQEDENASKLAKVEVPPSGFVGIGMGSPALRMPPQSIYSVVHSMHVPPASVPMHPLEWNDLASSLKPWSSAPPVIRQPPPMSLRLPQSPQPRFPIQNKQPPPSNAVAPLSQTPMLQRPPQPLPQPLFPIQNTQSLPSISAALSSQPPTQPLVSFSSSELATYATPRPQTLFPMNGFSHSNLSMCSSITMLPPNTLPQSPSMELRSSTKTSVVTNSVLQSSSTSKPFHGQVIDSAFPEEENASKLDKVEAPPSRFVRIRMESPPHRWPAQSVYSALHSMHVPPACVPMHPLEWNDLPSSSLTWSPALPAISMQHPSLSLRLPQSPQPLFVIQNKQPPPSLAVVPSSQSLTPQMPPQPLVQPLFPIQYTESLPSISAAPSSQPPTHPLFLLSSSALETYAAPHPQTLLPINGFSHSNLSMRSSLTIVPPNMLPQIPSTELRSSTKTSMVTDSLLRSGSTSKPSHRQVIDSTFPGALGPSAMFSHMYMREPYSDRPSIGPTLGIFNNSPGVQGATKEVYLVWDDEAMSMEERRLSLSQYEMHDETSQMNFVDTAIDRRISESRLAGRMGFGI